MSQIYKSSAGGGGLPPDVATSYQTNNGTAVPAMNVLIVKGLESVENNDNGIIVKGGTPATLNGNEVDVVLTNRATGSVSTTDATPTTVITFALGAVPGVYNFEGYIVAYDLTDTAGAVYSFYSGVRTTGAAGITIGTSKVFDNFLEAAMSTATFSASVSGNNFNITVTGIAGKNIDWNCYLIYRFIS